MIFADSSALVTVYAGERRRVTFGSREAVAVAEIARVEVPAAFWRKQRMGELTAGEASLLTAAFEADFFGTDDAVPRWIPVATASSVLDEAADLVARHGLRAYDAVQLASALSARRTDGRCEKLAAFDRDLRQSAAREGFQSVPAARVSSGC